MPTSNIGSVPFILDAILRKHYHHQEIKSILDVGIGWGKYGLLCREYVSPFEIMDYAWKLRLDGIEVYPTYIKPYTKGLYSNIFITDVRDFCEDPGKWSEDPYWDMILLIDIIEHMTKEEGIRVIEKLTHHARWLLVCTPEELKFYPEAVARYHPKEKHICLWKVEEFDQFSLDNIIWSEQYLIVTLEGDLLISKDNTDTIHFFNG